MYDKIKKIYIGLSPLRQLPQSFKNNYGKTSAKLYKLCNSRNIFLGKKKTIIKKKTITNIDQYKVLLWMANT